MFFFEIVQGCDFGGWCAVSPEFKTKEEVKRFCENIMKAVQLSNDLDREQKIVDAIDQTPTKQNLEFDTDLMDVETYNHLSELANLKNMSLKDTLKLCVLNEQHETPEFECQVMVPAQ